MLYRRPYGTEWEPLDLETATDMIADRVLASPARTWQDHDEHGRPLRAPWASPASAARPWTTKRTT